jgi:chromosome segregation ATPase
LRSHAQRREYQDLRHTLRKAQAVAAEREVSFAELRDWVTILEQQEETLRRDRQQLWQELETARRLAEQATAARQEAQQAQAAKLAESQEILRRTVEDRRYAQDRLVQTEQALRDVQYAATAQQEQAAAKLAESQETARRTAEDLKQTQDRLAQAEQALRDLQARASAESTAKQSLEQELTKARQSIDTLLQRCITAEQDCERFREKVSNRGDGVTLRRSEHEDLLEDQATKKYLKKQFISATDLNQELVAAKRRLEHELAECQDRLDEAAALATKARMTSQRRANNDPPLTALRNQVEQLQIAVLTAEHEKTSLRGTVQDLTAKLQSAERQRSTLEGSVGNLQAELADAQAQLRSRQSAENTQIAITGLKEASKIGLGAAVALLQNHLVKEFAQEVSAANATKEPSQVERLMLWQRRIEVAKRQGWKAEQDPLIAAKRDELTAADQLAKLQTSLGISLTARPLPYVPSLDDLALLEALDARSAFYRRHGGQWGIEFFQLDPKSEEVLRWDSVEATAGINAERNKLTRGVR